MESLRVGPEAYAAEYLCNPPLDVLGDFAEGLQFILLILIKQAAEDLWVSITSGLFI